MPHNVAEVHPETARDFGIDTGDRIFVESPRGRVECLAKLTPDIHPRMVQLFPGFEDANANVLTDDTELDPITGSAPMRSGLCRIGKALSHIEGEAA
jgi:anaerobic selenocysteine-containing dehydrogenase